MSARQLYGISSTLEGGPFYSEQGDYCRVQVNDLQETWGQSEIIKAYIKGLKKTYLNSLIAIFASWIIASPSVASLVCFAMTGKSFMHPYLSIFFTIFALGMLILGLLSAITTRLYFEKAIMQLTS